MNDRRVLVALVAIGMLLCSFPVTVDWEESDGAQSSGLMLYQVSTKKTSKGDIIYNSAVSLINAGNSTVNLNGYYVSDIEGKIKFSSDRYLAPGETVSVAASSNNHVAMGEVLIAGQNGISKTGSFDLNDSGDDVWLYDKNGDPVDAVCFGSKIITDTTVWSGDSVPNPYCNVIVRSGQTDTDSASDWKPYGTIDLDFDPNLKYEAEVTPFLFPNDGGIPVFRAVEEATESIFITMYQFSNKNMYSLLIDRAQSGVDVKLLIDGGSLGWSNDSMIRDLGYMRELQEAGGEVRLIGTNDYNRYEYVHAKYFIIDGDTTAIISENCTPDNFNGSVTSDDRIYYADDKGNRGWGAIIESTGYASYMTDVFEHDFSMEFGDVVTLDTFTDGMNIPNPGLMVYAAPSYSKTFPSYTAMVTPMISYESSMDAELYYIANATERVLSQQQSLSASYCSIDGNLIKTSGPLSAMQDAATSPEMDVRFILSLGIKTDDKEKRKQIVPMINSQTMIKAALMDFPYVHNKGLVCDDSTIVTSVNWTPTSFNNNRESGVIIHSATISDFFAEAFSNDFERVYEFDGPRASFIEYSRSPVVGSNITFTVEVLPVTKEYTYVWDFGDGSEPRTTTIPRISTTALEGTHTVSVTITDSDDPTFVCNTSIQYTTVEDESFDLSIITDHIEYIIPILVIVLGIIVKVLRR